MRMSIATVIVATFLGIAPAPSAAQTKPGDRAVFTVGSVKASRGQTATGAIDVPAGSDAALSIPIAVVHGAKPGPVLALLAGAHGTEYTSIIALEKLIADDRRVGIVGHGDHPAARERAVLPEGRAAPQSRPTART